MNEAIFPVLGTAIVLLFVLPSCALLAKICLVMLERVPARGMLHGLTLRYLLLTGSSVLPLAWLVSAGLHQAESGRSALACLFDHDASESCLESGYFALGLGLAILLSSLRFLRSGTIRVRPADSSQKLDQRITQLVARHPALSVLAGRTLISDDPEFALGACGLLRPQVVVGAQFARGLSDEMLRSALGHEAEHVRALDPLRYAVLQFALAINPLGRFFLKPHCARWLAARETHCDKEAVIHGAEPLSLASAIVRAARPCAHPTVGLGTDDTTTLKFRIALLLAFSERAPRHDGLRGPSAFPLALVLLLITLILPHQTTTKPLDALHAGAEHTLAHFSH